MCSTDKCNSLCQTYRFPPNGCISGCSKHGGEGKLLYGDTDFACFTFPFIVSVDITKKSSVVDTKIFMNDRTTPEAFNILDYRSCLTTDGLTERKNNVIGFTDSVGNFTVSNIATSPTDASFSYGTASNTVSIDISTTNILNLPVDVKLSYFDNMLGSMCVKSSCNIDVNPSVKGTLFSYQGLTLFTVTSNRPN